MKAHGQTRRKTGPRQRRSRAVNFFDSTQAYGFVDNLGADGRPLFRLVLLGFVQFRLYF